MNLEKNLEKLPREIAMKIFLYLECPIANMMKQEIKKYKSQCGIRMEEDSITFVEYYFDLVIDYRHLNETQFWWLQ